MQTNFRQIKRLISKIEKREKELATYKAKVSKIEKEIAELQQQLTSLLNTTQNTFSAEQAFIS